MKKSNKHTLRIHYIYSSYSLDTLSKQTYYTHKLQQCTYTYLAYTLIYYTHIYTTKAHIHKYIKHVHQQQIQTNFKISFYPKFVCLLDYVLPKNWLSFEGSIAGYFLFYPYPYINNVSNHLGCEICKALIWKSTIYRATQGKMKKKRQFEKLQIDKYCTEK